MDRQDRIEIANLKDFKQRLKKHWGRCTMIRRILNKLRYGTFRHRILRLG